MHTQSAQGEIYGAWQWCIGLWLAFDNWSTACLCGHDSASRNMVGLHAQRNFHQEKLDGIPEGKRKVVKCWFTFATKTEQHTKRWCEYQDTIQSSMHFTRCWQGEFILQSRASLVWDHSLYFCDFSVWFRILNENRFKEDFLMLALCERMFSA